MKIFQIFYSKVVVATGSPWAFTISTLTVVVWASLGPLFRFSDTWQLFINTTTTVLTFLMVFVIQASQNRDNMAIQLKLDELIRSQEGARNRFADLEEATEEELKTLKAEFQRLRKSSGGKTDKEK